MLNFWSNLYDKGISYSANVSAKYALATRMTVAPYQSLNDHSLIVKLITGIYNLNPPALKLNFVWDVSIIFQFFENCGPNGELSDKIFTQKLVFFLLLLGIQRVQTLFTFHIDKMVINNISVSFVSTQPLKRYRNRFNLDTFEYRAYAKPDLCVVACLREYLNRRSNRTDHKQLTIICGKHINLLHLIPSISGLKNYLQMPKPAILHQTVVGQHRRAKRWL